MTDHILRSNDAKLPGWRLRISWEDDDEILIAEEIVHPEQIDNPGARAKKRNATVILLVREAEWLHARLGEWLEFVKGGPIDERWYRPTPGLFEPEEHVNHARICPTCSGMLAKTEGGWKCASECPEISEDEMQRLLGRQTQPRSES